MSGNDKSGFCFLISGLLTATKHMYGPFGPFGLVGSTISFVLPRPFFLPPFFLAPTCAFLLFLVCASRRKCSTYTHHDDIVPSVRASLASCFPPHV